jgi:hypothetical protein
LATCSDERYVLFRQTEADGRGDSCALFPAFSLSFHYMYSVVG